MMGLPTFSPRGAVCGKCGIEVPNREGRRYRLKWRHEKCLPETRKAVIKPRTKDGGIQE